MNKGVKQVWKILDTLHNAIEAQTAQINTGAAASAWLAHPCECPTRPVWVGVCLTARFIGWDLMGHHQLLGRPVTVERGQDNFPLCLSPSEQH